MQTTDTTLNNLNAGIYTATVIDSNNCITQDSIELIEPDLLNTIDSVVNVSCFEGNDGEIYLSPNGGTPGYSFILISNGSGIDQEVLDLNSGLYIIQTTDTKGCTSMNDIFVSHPLLPVA